MSLKPKHVDFEPTWNQIRATVEKVIVLQHVHRSEWNDRFPDLYQLCVAFPGIAYSLHSCLNTYHFFNYLWKIYVYMVRILLEKCLNNSCVVCYVMFRAIGRSCLSRDQSISWPTRQTVISGIIQFIVCLTLWLTSHNIYCSLSSNHHKKDCSLHITNNGLYIAKVCIHLFVLIITILVF